MIIKISQLLKLIERITFSFLMMNLSSFYIATRLPTVCRYVPMEMILTYQHIGFHHRQRSQTIKIVIQDDIIIEIRDDVNIMRRKVNHICLSYL